MESECGGWPATATGAGGTASTDGLVFRFRYENCIPVGLLMRTTQRVFCAVSWTMDDDNEDNISGVDKTTFVVLRHDSLERAWCFRFHSAGAWHAEQLSGILFVGGIHCDVGDVGTDNTTINYVKIDLARDVDSQHHQNQHVVDGNLTAEFPDHLCVDDYEACSFWSDTTCDLEVCRSVSAEFSICFQN